MQEENNMSEQWQKTIQHIVDRVDDCIRNKNDESLTLKLLAQEFGYSEFHFSRKFREISGMQFREYLRCRRLAFSLRQLRDTEESVLQKMCIRDSFGLVMLYSASYAVALYRRGDALSLIHISL